MADLNAIQADVQTIATIAQTILASAPQTAAVGALVGPLAVLVTKALSAYSNASGVPVTVENIKLLYPDLTPLVEPKS